MTTSIENTGHTVVTCIVGNSADQALIYRTGVGERGSTGSLQQRPAAGGHSTYVILKEMRLPTWRRHFTSTDLLHFDSLHDSSL